jgi:hypothetical protein
MQVSGVQLRPHSTTTMQCFVRDLANTYSSRTEYRCTTEYSPPFNFAVEPTYIVVCLGRVIASNTSFSSNQADKAVCNSTEESFS